MYISEYGIIVPNNMIVKNNDNNERHTEMLF